MALAEREQCYDLCRYFAHVRYFAPCHGPCHDAINDELTPPRPPPRLTARASIETPAIHPSISTGNSAGVPRRAIKSIASPSPLALREPGVVRSHTRCLWAMNKSARGSAWCPGPNSACLPVSQQTRREVSLASEAPGRQEMTRESFGSTADPSIIKND